MAVEQGLDAKRIQELDRQHVLHSWSVQDQISPLPVAGAEGRYFWDYDGNRYLDFASQLVNVNLGHQHPKVVAAIKEQADKLTTIGPQMAHEARSELARLIAEVTPGDLTMSFFTNGGAEANENAIKLARWYTGRHKIVARYRSYHGATAGASTGTSCRRSSPSRRGSTPATCHSGRWSSTRSSRTGCRTGSSRAASPTRGTCSRARRGSPRSRPSRRRGSSRTQRRWARCSGP